MNSLNRVSSKKKSHFESTPALTEEELEELEYSKQLAFENAIAEALGKQSINFNDSF